MLANKIYYVDIITFVYKMCLFRPRNVTAFNLLSMKLIVRFDFCARKYVLASKLNGHNANLLVFHGFEMNLCVS